MAGSTAPSSGLRSEPSGSQTRQDVICKSRLRVTMLGAAVAVVLATTYPARAQVPDPRPADATPPPPDAPAAQTVQKDLQQLVAALTDEGARPEDRDEAARRLVS